MFEKICGVIVVATCRLILFGMILGGFAFVIREIEKENKREIDKMARRLANEMFEDMLRNTRFIIEQRIVVVDGEDLLVRGGDSSERTGTD